MAILNLCVVLLCTEILTDIGYPTKNPHSTSTGTGTTARSL